MPDFQIKRAKDNTERQLTYKQQLGRYSKAMKYGFYFEAMLITYSMLEDRLKSFLYHCGFFDNRNTLSVSKKVKNDVKTILFEGEPSKWTTLNNISTKMQYTRLLLIWANTVKNKDIKDNEYYCLLKSSLEGLDIGAFLKTLDDLNSWISYRNEVMHASMNKNIDSLYENLSEKVAEGMEIARFIDSQVKTLKTDGSIRKTLKMQRN